MTDAGARPDLRLSAEERVAEAREQVAGLLATLTFVYVLNFLDRQLLGILAKPIQDTLGVTDGQLGLIGGLYFAFFYCFIAVPVGWLADRTSRVGIVALACAIWSAATIDKKVMNNGKDSRSRIVLPPGSASLLYFNFDYPLDAKVFTKLVFDGKDLHNVPIE